MEYSAKARLPLQLCRYHLSFSLLINFHSYSFYQRGRIKRPLKFLRFGINAKGGEINRPKAKGPHHHQFLNFQKLFHKGKEIISIAKPFWQQRGELLKGELLFSQRKSIWNRRRIFKILKMPFEIIFLYHWLFAKEFEKTFTKDLQKQPKWCKCGPKC